MDKTWLNKNQNKKCILFFNGWGMDENAVKHLEFDNFDVCMFNNYNSLDDLSFVFGSYEECYIVAWSLGVWAAANVNLNGNKIAKSIAINGSPKPKDEDLGIPPAIFEATASNWDDKNKQKFNMRVVGGRKEYQLNEAVFGNRNVENQQKELIEIDRQLGQGILSEITFDTCIIGTKDLIFPLQNLKRYWTGKTEIKEVEMEHYPFKHFKSWQEIVEV